MTFFVYMLKTIDKKKPKTYVGYSIDISKRLDLHNSNRGAKATKGFKWKIIYKKKFLNKNTAMSYEYKLKNDRKYRIAILKKNDQ